MKNLKVMPFLRPKYFLYAKTYILLKVLASADKNLPRANEAGKIVQRWETEMPGKRRILNK